LKAFGKGGESGGKRRPKENGIKENDPVKRIEKEGTMRTLQKG